MSLAESYPNGQGRGRGEVGLHHLRGKPNRSLGSASQDVPIP
jgi:hypothetical protein